MNIFIKAIAGILVALILWISLPKQHKEFSLLLSLCVCAMAFAISEKFLRPLVQFIRNLQIMGNLDRDMLSVILKSVGIGMISEICVLLCKDAGNEAMGKSLQFLSVTVVLWLSIPVFERLLSLLDNILGSI